MSNYFFFVWLSQIRKTLDRIYLLIFLVGLILWVCSASSFELPIFVQEDEKIECWSYISYVGLKSARYFDWWTPIVQGKVPDVLTGELPLYREKCQMFWLVNAHCTGKSARCFDWWTPIVQGKVPDVLTGEVPLYGEKCQMFWLVKSHGTGKLVT